MLLLVSLPEAGHLKIPQPAMLGSTSLLDPSVWWHHVSMLHLFILAVNSCGLPSEIQSSPAVVSFRQKHWEFIGPCNKNSLRYGGRQKIWQSQQSQESQPKYQIATRNHQILGFLGVVSVSKPGNGSTRGLAPKLRILIEICWPSRIPLSADWMISNPKRPDISSKVYYVDAGRNPANHLRCIKPVNGRINFC